VQLTPASVSSGVFSKYCMTSGMWINLGVAMQTHQNSECCTSALRNCLSCYTPTQCVLLPLHPTLACQSTRLCVHAPDSLYMMTSAVLLAHLGGRGGRGGGGSRGEGEEGVGGCRKHRMQSAQHQKQLRARRSKKATAPDVTGHAWQRKFW
jgi:hypothetical protein